MIDRYDMADTIERLRAERDEWRATAESDMRRLIATKDAFERATAMLDHERRERGAAYARAVEDAAAVCEDEAAQWSTHSVVPGAIRAVTVRVRALVAAPIPAPAPVDEYPREPRDDAEREAVATRHTDRLCNVPGPVGCCARRPHAVGDHIFADYVHVLARWPQVPA